MPKRIYVLVALCLTLGLLAACTSPAGQLNTFMRQLSRLEDYAFTAVGELTLEDGIYVGATPLRYVMEGTRATETGQLAASIHYTDAMSRQLYDISLFEADETTYVRFVPLFQYLMDQTYTDIDAGSVALSFAGNPYLIHPGLELANLLPNLPTLVDSLDSAAIRAGLNAEDGERTLRLTGEQLDDATLTALTRPFGLFADLGTLVAAQQDAVLSPLLAGERADYMLELTFSQSGMDAFIASLTLTAPGLLTLTTEITYQAITANPIAPPYHTIEMAEMRSVFADYRAAQARALFLAASELSIVTDLPELHMVNHQLGTALLEPFEMEIGEEPFDVSVMTNAVNTSGYGVVYSVSSAMTLLYTTLDAHTASETLAMFILIDLDVDDLDAENFQRADMRINAHDTAAVNALFYDDNHMGRTLRIYVLQAIGDTDQALFLGVTVFLENMTRQGMQVLDRLGFYIGIDFQAYLDWAAEE